MMRFQRTAILGMAGMLLAGAAYADGHGMAQDTVVDHEGKVVINTFDNCVRTKWEAASDVCAAPEPEPVKAAPPPPPSPARKLTRADKTVYFNFDKATLTDDARARLDSLAQVLKSSKDVRQAKIVGFADRIGGSDYNQKLSERRAKAVKDYLAERGYLNTQVAKVRGLGESQPITNCAEKQGFNKKVACLQPDRRVEVEIEFLK